MREGGGGFVWGASVVAFDTNRRCRPGWPPHRRGRTPAAGRLPVAAGHTGIVTLVARAAVARDAAPAIVITGSTIGGHEADREHDFTC